MIAIDWVILIIVGYNMVMGMFRGFIRMLFDLAALALSIYAVTQFREPFAAWISGIFPMAPMALDIVSILLLWGGVYIIVIAVGMGINKMASLFAMGPLNALAGILLGVVRGALIAAPVVMIWQLVVPDIMQQSLILCFFIGKIPGF